MNSFNENSSIKKLCSDLSEHSSINPKLYDKFFVKRGLRNSDGTGVVAGITNICNVHGYVVNEGDREPIDGELIYRGYSIKELVENVTNDDRFGFEEITYLLLTGKLPNKKSLAEFVNATPGITIIIKPIMTILLFTELNRAQISKVSIPAQREHEK